jgi:hypothetical protein
MITREQAEVIGDEILKDAQKHRRRKRTRPKVGKVVFIIALESQLSKRLFVACACTLLAIGILVYAIARYYGH